MRFLPTKLCLLLTAILAIYQPALGNPVVTYSTTTNIGGSGFDAIDFFYEATPGGEFSCYQLTFDTSNGSMIYDPLPGARGDAGSDAVDTFMNTVASLYGEGDASYLYGTYKPGGPQAAPAFVDSLDWVVFDLFQGDTNTYNGNSAPYHLARVLVQPDAMWHATMHAFDNIAKSEPKHNFTNDPNWSFPQPTPPPPPANPDPPPITIPDPVPPPTFPDPTPPPPTLPDPTPSPPVNPGPVAPPAPPTIPITPPAQPIVTTSTVQNIGGSGYDAIDFYFEASPGAEFSCFEFKFGTSNGARIYDPLPAQKQDVGGDAIDTFVNTVGSLAGDGDASILANPALYNPSGADVEPASTDELEWVVFDLLQGDTNTYNGNSGPYHLARVLVEPDAMWHATMRAFDNISKSEPKHNFTNDPNWTFPSPVTPPPPAEPDPLPPSPPPTVENPSDPPPVVPPPSDAPVIDNPPPSEPDSPTEPIYELPIVRPFPFPGRNWLDLTDWLNAEELNPIHIMPWIGTIDTTLYAGTVVPFLYEGALLPGQTIDVDHNQLLFHRITTAHVGAEYASLNGWATSFAFDAGAMGADQVGVPEPSSLLLAVVALFFALPTRRR